MKFKCEPVLKLMLRLTFQGLTNFGKNSENNAKENSEQADHALVIMFSSLSHDFNQPIAIFGSKGTVKSNTLAVLTLQAIIEVEKAGGKVQGIVCDGATTNRSMWTEFGISEKLNKCQNKFNNPYDETRFMHAFSDAPHLIKCIRNRFQSKKILKVCICNLLYMEKEYFKYNFINKFYFCPKVNGDFIKWDYYEHLYIEDSKNSLRVCPKLTDNHIKPSNTLKIRVFLATQVIILTLTFLFYCSEKYNRDSNLFIFIRFSVIL